MSAHLVGNTAGELYGLLRAHANTLSAATLAIELKDFLRTAELADLSLRFRAEFAKL